MLEEYFVICVNICSLCLFSY